MRMVFSKKFKRLVPVPTLSKNFRQALTIALPALKKQWAGYAPVGDKENRLWVEAHFMAGKGSVPDLDGCLVGCGDLLQRAGVVSNDRWIRSWDKSRIHEWRDHMREECTVLRISWYVEDEV